MFGAGSDTSASAVSVAVMAATCYPDAAKVVQNELDAVVGKGRGKLGYAVYAVDLIFLFLAPTFADQDSLPQTMAFVLESFRWRPVTSGGFPHKATKDIIWVRFQKKNSLWHASNLSPAKLLYTQRRHRHRQRLECRP